MRNPASLRAGGVSCLNQAGRSRLASRGDVLVFFLGCVVVAGAYGAWSVSRRIFWIQALPALLALGALFARL